MTNYEIARRFERIGDILEIQGENPFKVRAYRRAAEAIDELAEPLEEIEARGDLAQIPGFGPAIVGKTRDFLRTGTTKLYEQIKNAVPPGVVAMAAISGVGPKTAKTLWDALGVTNAEALEAAARAGGVRALPGFGPGKEKNLIEAMERARRLGDRVPLYVALPFAERLTRELAARPEVGRVAVAGSLRRGQATVGEIVLVGASSDPEATTAAFARLPGITETLETGPARIAALCDLGLRVDLHLGGDADFSARFRRHSSDEAHNAELRALAEARGIEIGGHGIGDEEGIYAALGLPFIPPELREGTGEIEAAREGRLPHLVTEADFRGQLHCHSTYSDGAASVREMAEAALGRGYEYLAITDHSRSLQVANGLDRERLLRQLDEIAELNAEFVPRGLTILTGQEVDILADGALDGDDDLLARLDIVVASVHIRRRETEAEMTARVVRAVENPHTDILGHPTGRLLGRREPYPMDMEAIIRAAVRTGTILEINAAPERMDLDDAHVRRAREAGAKFTVNADAHSTRGLGLLRWGLFMAHRAWLTPDDVINTVPLAALREALK